MWWRKPCHPCYANWAYSRIRPLVRFRRRTRTSAPGTSARNQQPITDCPARGSLLPNGQRFADEPTRIDPVLGMTAYLEPDFATLTPMRAFKVPQQLRGPHPAVTAFQVKREHVSRAQIPRAARYLQGLVNAVAEMGWSAPAKVQAGYAGRGEPGPTCRSNFPLASFRSPSVNWTSEGAQAAPSSPRPIT